jgi:uncharacterized protein (DUF58 family)
MRVRLGEIRPSKVSIRPTIKLAAIMGATIPVATIMAAFLEVHWPLALVPTLLCLILTAADVSMTAQKPLRGVIELDDSTYLGARFGASLTLSPPKDYPRGVKIEAELEIDGPAENQAVSRSEGELIGEDLALVLPIAPKRRGLLSAAKLWLRWRGPLGLCQARQIEPLMSSVSVLQNIGGIHQAALQFFHREADLGQKSQPFKGEGSEFDSLMDYAVGMDNRLIDWKHSARHRKLLAKDFRQERNHQIVLCFDAGRLLTEPVRGVPKLDHFIRSALILSWVSLLSGDMVGACRFDLGFRAFLKPGRGRNFFARIQRFTSEIDYTAFETNFTIALTELKARLPHRSLIVIFTEFIDPVSAEFLVEGLGLLAKKHMVLFVTTPDPLLSSLKDAYPGTVKDLASSVMAEDFQRSRSIVLQRAARQGIHSIDAPPGALSTAILNRYLTIKQRGLL